MKSSEVTTTVSGRKKASSDEVVHAEYKMKFQDTLALYDMNDEDVNKLQKEQVLILLWVGFKIFYRKNNKKMTTPVLRGMLSEKIVNNPSWLKQPHTK